MLKKMLILFFTLLIFSSGAFQDGYETGVIEVIGGATDPGIARALANRPYGICMGEEFEDDFNDCKLRAVRVTSDTFTNYGLIDTPYPVEKEDIQTLLDNWGLGVDNEMYYPPTYAQLRELKDLGLLGGSIKQCYWVSVFEGDKVTFEQAKDETLTCTSPNGTLLPYLVTRNHPSSFFCGSDPYCGFFSDNTYIIGLRRASTHINHTRGETGFAVYSNLGMKRFPLELLEQKGIALPINGTRDLQVEYFINNYTVVDRSPLLENMTSNGKKDICFFMDANSTSARWSGDSLGGFACNSVTITDTYPK